VSARVAAAWITVVLAGRLWVATHWGLLADEAYHWVWSLHPAWGYFDQPPLIAWVLAATRPVLGETPLALRALPIGAAIASVAALTPFARDRVTWLLWGLGLPPLWLMTQLAVPDTLLIAAWGGALAAVLRGGRWWLLAGVLAGLAAMAKPTGLLLMPLLLAADPAGRRTPWPWLGAALAAVVVAPNLAWNALHDGVMFRFQIAEGLLHPGAAGWLGPVRQVAEQALFVTPVAGGAALVWAVRRPFDRIDRLCWAVSVPVLVGFAVAALGGPPEAHWPAPAWLGVGLGLSRSSGRLLRAAGVGAWLGALATLTILLHAQLGLLRLGLDPAVRLSQGAVIGAAVARAALPIGVSAGDPRATEATAVVTERYQEAALIHYYTGIPARTLPGCGRRSQYDLWPNEVPAHAWFVRPARTGVPTCAAAHFSQLRRAPPVGDRDGAGRWVGSWDLYDVRR